MVGEDSAYASNKACHEGNSAYADSKNELFVVFASNAII